MKLYRQFVITFCIIMHLISCQNNGYEFPQAPIQVFLTEDNMPPIEYFTLEKVELPDAAQMNEVFFVYADTLLITKQNKNPNPYMLSVYNLKTRKLVAGYFTKGIGPAELVSIHCSCRKNEIFAIDVTQNKVAVLNIDSIALLGFDYIPTIISTDGICTEYTRCVNDTLIGINDFHFYGFGYENVPEFVKVSCANGKFFNDYLPKNIYGSGPLNINMRISYFNEFTKQYIVAWRHYPYINIYDEHFKLQKQYVGPDNYMPNLIEHNNVGVRFVSDSHPGFYAIGCQTKNYSFYLNDRIYEKNYDWKTANSEIYCFDKALHFVRRLKQKKFKATLSNPSYCEETGNLYINVMNEDCGEWELYKCILEK